MKRYVFISIILLVFAVVVYYVIDSTSKASDKLELNIVVFGNYDNLEQHSQKVILEFLNSSNYKKANSIKLVLFSINNISGEEIEIKSTMSMDPGKEKEDSVKIKLKESFSKMSKKKLTNVETNSLVNKLMITIENLSKDKQHTLLLFGRFPECYKKEDFAKTNLQSQLRGNRYSYTTIVWGLNTDNSRPETKELLRIFNKKAFVVEDRTDSSPLPICTQENLKNVYAVMFNKFNPKQATEFLNALMNRFGENIRLTLWNDGPINNQTAEIIDGIASKEFSELLKKTEKGQWTSVGYLIKQANNMLSQVKPEIEKNLIIVGNLPIMGPGNQLDTETWKSLQKVNKLNSFYYLPKGAKKNETDILTLKGLEILKFNINELGG